MTDQAKAKLFTVASFPENYFLENLAVRADNSVLIKWLTDTLACEVNVRGRFALAHWKAGPLDRNSVSWRDRIRDQ
jgi:hypothetical protein